MEANGSVVTVLIYQYKVIVSNPFQMEKMPIS